MREVAHIDQSASRRTIAGMQNELIVVVGATGATGAHLVQELMKSGHKVRATVRDVDRAREKLGPKVELAIVDLEKPETYSRALEGAQKLYVAVGGATGTPELVAVEKRFIDAARAAGVKQYVKCSGIDSAPDAPAKIQRMHGEIEVHLRASGMGFTVLRPGFFMQNFLGLAPAIAQGVLPIPTGNGRCALIDARDIADVAKAVLTSDGHLGKTYTLTGPELFSHGEVAQLMTRVLERPVSFADVPGEAFKGSLIGAGLPAWFAELLTDVYVQIYAPGLIARVSSDVERLLGRKGRTLADFVREHRPLLRG